jgi:amino acid transporter
MQRAVPAGGATGEAFLRKSSGLVRSAGATDVFFFNLGLISVGIAIALDQLYGPAFYPGGSVAGASVLAATLMVPIGLTFYFWTVTYPRSGGPYVYLSRGAHPLLGFAFSVTESFILLFYGAAAAAFVATMGLSPLLAILGYETGSSTLTTLSANVAGQWGIFLVGTVIIVLGGALLISGMARYFTVQRILLGLAILGTLVTIGILAAGSRDTFTSNFDSYMGKHGSYQAAIAGATKAGWTSGSITFGATLALLVWPLLPLLGAIQSIGIGGEIKRVTRSQIIGIFAALAVAVLLMVAVALLSDNVFGTDFQGAIAYNALSSVSPSTPITPWFTLLASLLANNPLVTVIIAGTMCLWPFFWVPLELAYVDRSMLAWSLDRMAPERLGYVSDRYHTPVVAIVVCVLVAIVFLALYAFTPWFGTLSLIEALSIIWGACMLFGALMPYIHRDVWAKSPASRYTVAGVPLITISGLLGTAAFAYVIYLLWNDAIAAGHTNLSVGVQLGLFAAGLLAYFAVKYVRASRGVDVAYAFKEIPVE